jgi:hypothetical protein
MSTPDRRDLSLLAHRLASAPGAVAVLLALLVHGGSAAREVLAYEAADDDLDQAIRWLVTARLIQRVSASGSLDFDAPGTVYAFTDVGVTLAGSLAQLGEAMAEIQPPHHVTPELRRSNQRRLPDSKTTQDRTRSMKTR